MGVTPPPTEPQQDAPRSPRPGDPFANPAGNPKPKSPPLIKRKKGYRFFLIMLIIAGIMTVASIMLVTNGKEVIVKMYRDMVIPSIPEALPVDYPIEKGRKLIQTLDRFFEQVDDGKIDDDVALEMMGRIEQAVGDQLVTDAEVDALMESARTLGNRE